MPPISRIGSRAAVRVAAAALVLCVAGVATASTRPAFVALVVLDTTRADRLPTYGAERATAPALDALAAGGVVFERALAAAPWTVPSHASLFTGVSPGTLGVGWQQRQLPAAPPVIAELFREAGFRTIGLSQNPMLTTETGFARGFDQWRDVKVGASLEALQEALRDLPAEPPLFVFANLIAPHLPYAPPERWWREFVGMADPRSLSLSQLGWKRLLRMRSDGTLTDRDLATLRNLYDAEIRRVDAELAALLDALRAARPGDGIVVVTADHGENIGDHGLFDHQLGVPNTLLHVPLVISAPGRVAPRRVATPVSLADVPRTLAALAGLPRSASLPGADLLAPTLAAEPVVSEYERPVPILEELARCCPAVDRARFDRVLAAAQDARFKLVLASDGTKSLFDLARDPGETQDLLGAPPLSEDASAALARLEPPARRSLDARIGRGTDAAISDEERARLRALGYVDDAP